MRLTSKISALPETEKDRDYGRVIRIAVNDEVHNKCNYFE